MENVRLIIKPTLQCNCRCVYCFAQRPEIPDMPYELLEHIFREIGRFTRAHNIGTVDVAWHGGEPMLVGADFYRKAMEFQTRYWPHLSANHSMTTNLTLYTGELRKVLLHLFGDNDEAFSISWDPSHPTRPFAGGEDSAKATLKGCLALKEDGFSLRLGYVVHKKSIETVVDLYNICRNLGSDSLWVVPADEHFAACHGDYSLTSQDWGVFLKRLWETWEDDDFGFLEISPLGEWRDAIIEGGPVTNCEYGTPWERTTLPLSIAPNGDLGACPTIQDAGLFPIGNLRNMSIEDIAAHRMTYIITEKRETLPAECLECQFVSLCGSGCLPTHDETGKTAWCKGITFFFEYLKSRGILTDDRLQYTLENAEYIQRQIRNRSAAP